MPSEGVRIGVLSDTHGLLRPEAIAELGGAELIVHAGDVGDPSILERLGDIAPVRAVRGNVDTAPWARALPEAEVVEVPGALVYVLHDLSALDLDPRAAGFAAVVYGHSHRPSIESRGGVLYLNPGSAGPRRFRLPVSLAWLVVEPRDVRARLVELVG